MRRKFLSVLFCLFLLAALPACQAPKADRNSQWKEPFTAEIEGTRGELAFSAELTVTAEERVIRYTAPASLAGLTATATEDGIRVVQGDLAKQVKTNASGLFLPLDLLTSPAELATVTMREGETVLTYTDGTEILLNANGTPRAVIRSDILFMVANFQKTPENE